MSLGGITGPIGAGKSVAAAHRRAESINPQRQIPNVQSSMTNGNTVSRNRSALVIETLSLVLSDYIACFTASFSMPTYISARRMMKKITSMATLTQTAALKKAVSRFIDR